MAKKIQWTQKYRPKSLREYIGNKFIKLQLTTLIEQGEVPQTIMFYGEKGTGKTTVARLLVKNLSCLRPVKGEACGKCDSCSRLDETYITTGKAPKNMYVKELNIADLRGVDDAELIVADMKKSVGFNRKRIFILDEMQEASPVAQSTFLKIMEEPIPNLYVIMCTTHPDKITEALASRFKRFRVKRPKVNEISERLEHIAASEGVKYDRNAIRIIANHHKSNPRESINQLEILAVTTEFNLTVKNVEEQLELVSKGIFEKFLRTCKLGNLNSIIQQIEVIEEEGLQVKDFVNGLGNYMVDLLKIRAGVNIELYTVDQIKDMKDFVKMFKESDILVILKVLKDYSNLTHMDFQLYGIAVEIMEGLKVEETVTEITDSKAKERYLRNTKKIVEQASKESVTLGVADAEYMEKRMPGVNKVKGLPTEVKKG